MYDEHKPSEKWSLKVRRHKVFDDFKNAIEKPWNTNNFQRELKIDFVGESAVDDGGPKKELFTRKFILYDYDPYNYYY